MRVRALSLLILLLVPVFAGCTDPDADSEREGEPSPEPSTPPDDSDGPDPKEQAGRYMPWTRSDHWTFDMQVRGFEASRSHLVYYQEVGPEYQIGAATYEEALHQAVFGVNPLLGRIHKGHLSPHTRGEHAKMFPFDADGVIQDGAEWSTTLYDRRIHFTATYDEAVPTPNGTEPGYRIEGADRNTGFRMAHSYVPSVKWFTYLQASDADGVVLDLRLAETGTGYSGDAHFIRSTTLFDATLATSTVPLEPFTFEVAPDHVDAYRVEGLGVHPVFEMGEGLFAMLLLKDPEGNEIWRRQHDDPEGTEVIWPDGSKPSGPIEDRPQWPAGTYTFEFLSIGEATAEVIVVGTQDNSGSV